MIREGNTRRTIIPRLGVSLLKRQNGQTKSVESSVEISTSQDSAEAVSSSDVSPTLTDEVRHPVIENEKTSQTLKTTSTLCRRSFSDLRMTRVNLGGDFGSLLKIPAIGSQESLWIDLQPAYQGDGMGVAVDGQYLSSLNSFVNLRCLWVTGMHKSYQKQLFKAIWKMERLEDLQVRMAEEPRISENLPWRAIKDGWVPESIEPQGRLSSIGDGKGRIKKKYGNAEYLDNFVIELAKPSSWTVLHHLPIVHLTLRGFVVDAIPFFSCFDARKLRSITFKDCVDAGFCLPDDMRNVVTVRVEGPDSATTASIRHVVPIEEVKQITLKGGKKVDESPASHVSSRSRYRPHHVQRDSSGSSFVRTIPRYVAKQSSSSNLAPTSTSTSTPSSASPLASPSSSSFHGSSSPSSWMPSGQTARQTRFPLGFRKRVVSAVIEEDEAEG